MQAATFLNGAGIALHAAPLRTATLNVRQSTISDNLVFDRRFIGDTDLRSRAGGGGISVIADDPTATVHLYLVESTLDGNIVHSGTPYQGSDGQADTYGGGIYYVAGDANSRFSVVSSTISNNIAQSTRAEVATARRRSLCQRRRGRRAYHPKHRVR